MFNNIYNTGNVLNEWLISEFIIVPRNREPKHAATTDPSAS